jgi:5-formyltetrahydrofolate cyclo-ligase
MPKRSLREQLLAVRRHLSAETCLHLSTLIQTRFLASDVYRRAQCLGLYNPVLNEVHTEIVARRCLADGKRLAYPRVRGAELEFAELPALEALVPGAFGIGEPPGDHLLPLAELDLLVLPGVGFDLAGYRLGFGRGYYDRALADVPPELERVGFAYEFQVIGLLPVAAHDCRLTLLVTEQRMLRFPVEGEADLNSIQRRGGAEC